MLAARDGGEAATTLPARTHPRSDLPGPAEAVRLTRDWSPARWPIHCCLWDRSCLSGYRHYYMPLRLYLHFLKGRDGRSVEISLWGERRHARWLASLDLWPVDRGR